MTILYVFQYMWTFRSQLPMWASSQGLLTIWTCAEFGGVLCHMIMSWYLMVTGLIPKTFPNHLHSSLSSYFPLKWCESHRIMPLHRGGKFEEILKTLRWGLCKGPGSAAMNFGRSQYIAHFLSIFYAKSSSWGTFELPHTIAVVYLGRELPQRLLEV